MQKIITKIVKTKQNMRLLQPSNQYFSENRWKEKEEATQKIYIDKNDRTSLKKLLNRINEDQVAFKERESNFQQKLHQLLAVYDINNEAFEAQINQIHKLV